MSWRARTGFLVGVVVLSSAGCPGAPPPPPPPRALPAATTVCYAGTSTGHGQRAHTIARRTVDPATKQIVEDVRHDDPDGHGAGSFHVVMAVTGDAFTMTETGGAFTGEGQLRGEPWRWTSWSSVSRLPHTDIEVDSDDELTDVGMTAKKQIKKNGAVVATTVDDLRTFDCATWDAAAAELGVPPLDDGACELACRNFVTLKFWERVDAELAAHPPADPAATRAAAEGQLGAKLAAGLPACITQCRAANNPVSARCMATATTAAALAGCE